MPPGRNIKRYTPLHLQSPPPIPIHTSPFQIDDSIPTDVEIGEVLKTLKNGRAGGPSGLKVEDLKSWYFAACEPPVGTEPDDAAIEIWKKLVAIVQEAFRNGELPIALGRGILVLIPKSTPGQFRGIALLEVMYKLVSAICNRRMQRGIEFDDAIHGFRRGRGTGTAIMEAKLLMQLHCRQNEPLFMIFIDLKKAYDTLDRSAALRVLKGYGVGPNILRILASTWENDTMVPRQSGYFGRSFHAERGVRQGDIISPLIFNVMVDVVVRHWRHLTGDTLDTTIFYADDGLLAGTDAQALQQSLNIITEGFNSLGLKMNASKTEWMETVSRTRKGLLSTAAYNRKWTGNRMTYAGRRLEKVQCLNCGSLVARSTLSRHQKSRKCKVSGAAYVPPTPVRDRVERET